MSVTEVCLIIIASCLVLKLLGALCFMIVSARILRKRVLPLLDKVDGALDNITAVTLSARDQVDELRSVVDDMSYRARIVARDVQERVIPPIVDTIDAFSGVVRVLRVLFGWARKRR